MIIVARYKDTCRICHCQITVGSKIEWSPGRASHVTCNAAIWQPHQERSKIWKIAKDVAINGALNAERDMLSDVINEIYTMKASEGKKFIEKLKTVCLRTLGNDNVTGIPGGHANWAFYEMFVMEQANALRKQKRDLKRLYTEECNRYLTPHEVTERDLAEKAVVDICKRLHIGYELCGDPRGAVVLLHFPNGETNDFGGTGWVVP